jgi:hypothetical protein
MAGWAEFFCGPIAVFLPCNDPEVETTTPGKLGNDKHDPQKVVSNARPGGVLLLIIREASRCYVMNEPSSV